MLRQILGVGGWTLISRVTGLIRDIVIAAVLGSGLMYEAFAYAFRLPNHFRAISGKARSTRPMCRATPRRKPKAEPRRPIGLPTASSRCFSAPRRSSSSWRSSSCRARRSHCAGPLLAPEEFELVVALTRITFPSSSPDHARDPAHGDAERLASVRRRHGGTHPSQRLARVLRRPVIPVPERRACGGLRRHLVGGAAARRARWWRRNGRTRSRCRADRFSTNASRASSAGSAPRPSAPPASRSRSSSTPDCRPSSGRARWRRSTTPSASTSCRSA